MSTTIEKVKHTPGPWKMHPPSSVVGSLISYGDLSKGENICAVMPQLDIEQCRANAQVIAATPDLADLVLRMYTHVSHGSPTRAEAKAVLQKAGLL